MRSSSAVLGNPGDGRSGMVIRAVVHFMEAAAKIVEVLLAFESYSRGTNRGLTHR